MSTSGLAAKAKVVPIWILTVLDAAAMGLAGFSKFGNRELWASMFEGWGYPGWFAIVIGAGEIGLSILLLVPRLASYAATGLIVIMLGALGTVLLHPGGRMGPGAPTVHLIVLTVILISRWGNRLRR